MPKTKSSKKALRVSLRRKKINLIKKKELKEKIKELKKLAKENKKEEVKKFLPLVYKAIDKAKKRGIIKPNTANRKKSQAALLAKK